MRCARVGCPAARPTLRAGTRALAAVAAGGAALRGTPGAADAGGAAGGAERGGGGVTVPDWLAVGGVGSVCEGIR